MSIYISIYNYFIFINIYTHKNEIKFLQYFNDYQSLS